MLLPFPKVNDYIFSSKEQKSEVLEESAGPDFDICVGCSEPLERHNMDYNLGWAEVIS